MADYERFHDYARVLLASIRLVNGGLALVAPGFLARRVGIDAEVNPGVAYVFRMFGIRTILIGADLLAPRGERRNRALYWAPLIHASDTLAAYLAARSSRFPRQDRLIVWISAVNTLLAVLARR